MTPIKSSTVKAVEHDGHKTLKVAFHSGATYSYQNVKPEQYNALKKAKSAGIWVRENLVKKPQAHPATKLPDKPKAKAARHVLGMGKLMGNYQQPPAS